MIYSAGIDTTPPTITYPGCPDNIHAEASGDRTDVTFTPPTATDPSGILVSDSNWGSATTIRDFPTGSYTVVEYIFIDNAGNQARCAFTISVSSKYIMIWQNKNNLIQMQNSSKIVLFRLMQKFKGESYSDGILYTTE